MADSSDSVSVDMETIYLGGKEHLVRTGSGSVSVIVYGDQDKPALLTYPDLALNHMLCFQGLFFCPEAASLLLHNFCIYHISPPGHELGAAAICPDDPVPSVDDLTDQILEVLNYFRLGAVMFMGAMAGAYIVTLFAMKYRERVLGLILISPLCKAPSWSEWLCNKLMSNLLYFYGMCHLLKDCLLYRYFSKELRGSAEVPESDIVQSCRRLLDERQSINVFRFLQAIDRRPDITERLKSLRCRTLIFVGDNSPFHSESLHMTAKMDRRYSALVEVQACGSMVTEEQPHAMLIPMEYFLMGYGLYRPSQFSGSPRSPLSPSCISPELLSPESMGLKLKPIKTRLLGVPDQAEKDEIVKSVMHLKNSEIEEGYTMDAVVSRQNLLMDVRDKLLFEPEYAGNTREKVPPKSSLRIPWAWLPGALCLLQEVGEDKLVLDIGRTALNHADAKLYIHDLLLSMALAECAIAKICFEKNNISQGFEALARAQCLLRSKVSLEKMPLLSQIEESLEELAPACTLEILGIPHTPENAERRLGAIAALRELLRQGLDVETLCQVQDWPCFLYQALSKLMATEIVELLPWDNLASTRKNKKSIESQNQRVIIDCNCLYLVLIAHIALGFSSKQKDLITKARTICESLIASEGIDLKFEESFCLLLLGQGDESMAAEKLRQLNLISNNTSRNLISGKEIRDVPSANQSLESWIKDTLLVLFPDTRDSSPSLENFFVGEKKAGNRQSKRAPQTPSSIGLRPLSPSPSDRRAYEEPNSCTNTSRNLGTAVKQLAASNLQGPSVAVKANSGSNGSSPSVQLKRNLGAHRYKVWDIWFERMDVGGNIIVLTALGCILFLTFKLMGMQLRRMKITSGWASKKPKIDTSSLAWTTDSSLDQIWGPACIKGNSIASRLKQLLSTQKMQLRSWSEADASQNSSLNGSQLSSKTAVYKRPMHVEEAETLVKQWQTIKAEALGPNHQVHSLFEVLDEPMLVQWQALADAAQTKSCFWRFVLLQLSILRADILSDEIGNEMAEIEALLEEAAELVDASQPKNPNYYSTYTIRYLLKRQEDGSWRFCEGDIQTPS